jgi:hypothetical protein
MLREPLVAVALLGAALFVLYQAVAPPEVSQEIVVTADVLAGLRQDFRRRTGREPSAADERGLVDRYVADEAMVREAIAMGLDRGDIVIRRRLLQKMEFVLENSDPVPDATRAELEAYFRAHVDRYTTPARVSFTHVFVSGDTAAKAPALAGELRTRLVAGADPATLGDPFLRGRDFRLHSEADLTNVFGPAFAKAVMALGSGEWSEPIRSTYGLHVVRIGERRTAGEPDLASVRARVEQDRREEIRAEKDTAARERLLAQYTVTVETKAP